MNWRDHLGRLLTLRCEGSSFLISKELDDPLDLSERLAMWGHVLACRSCRRFRDHLRRIGEAYRRRGARRIEFETTGEGLSPESRRRIAEAMRRATGNGPEEGT